MEIKDVTVIKYNPGDIKTRDGVIVPSENVVFVERGGALDNEEALANWLKTIKK